MLNTNMQIDNKMHDATFQQADCAESEVSEEFKKIKFLLKKRKVTKAQFSSLEKEKK